MANSYMSQKMEDFLNSMKWRTVFIDGKGTNYEVSDCGLVKHSISGIIMRPYEDKDGYLRMQLAVNDDVKNVRVHRLVANAFIPNPDPTKYTQVNHIDCNKHNNDVTNLEWVTPKENIQHSVRNGLNGLQGELNPTAIYTEEEIRKACELMMDPEKSVTEVAYITGISTATLYAIRNHKEWIHIGNEYNFPNIRHNYGENHVNNKYTLEQIVSVCELLEDPQMSLIKISRLTGVHKMTVSAIKAGNAWKFVSKDYNFAQFDHENHPSLKNNGDQIRKVCELLMDIRKTYEDIEKETGVSWMVVAKVYSGKLWNSISKDYKFPKREGNKESIKNPWTNQIVEMLKNSTDMESMVKVVQGYGISDRRTAQRKIYSIRRDMKVKASA